MSERSDLLGLLSLITIRKFDLEDFRIVELITSVVNRPVRPELGRNGAVFFEAGRGRTEGTAVIH